MLADLKQRIADVDAVSFDVFDTLFVRPLHDPEDLFDIVGERCGIKGFRWIRQQAQRLAFQKMLATGRSEISLDDIYDCLPSLGVSPAVLREAEYELELSLTIPNPRLIDIFQSALTQKPVVVTSDMYLPRKFFEALFQRHGLKPTALFISSDRNATKRDHGELFDIVAEELGISPSRILHVGDNPLSDVERAKEKGFAVYHYDDSIKTIQPKRSSISTSLAIGLRRVVKNAPESGSFQELGFNFGGPAAVAFIDWISRKAKEDHIDVLLFVSRDGYILEQIAHCDRACTLPRFSYFKGSRVAFTLAATDEGNFDSQVDFFLAGSHGLRPIELLERIGVAPPSDDVMNDLGLGAAVVVSDDNMAQVRSFLSAYRAEILQICRRNRRGLFQYLLQTGIEPGMRIAMVDIGWNGTTQDAFDQALRKLIKVDLFGYYLCLNDSEDCKRRQRSLNMDALLSSASIGAERLARVYANRVAVELLFSAPHSAVIGYRPGRNGHVEAVEDPGRACAAEHSSTAVAIANGVRDFADHFSSLCASISVKPDSLGTALPLVDFAETITPSSCALLASVENFDAWGSSRNQRVVLSDYLV